MDTDRVKISYTSKQETTCPICQEKFRREELHGGRGRLIVDSLTDQLRHTYKPSKEYGIVNPLLYPITVCPYCMYAAFKEDFVKIKEESVSQVMAQQGSRITHVKKLFPAVNFMKKRSFPEGISSYYLALHCYELLPHNTSPTFRRALCALRCAWLCNDMDELSPNQNWNVLRDTLYKKSHYFYRLAIENDEKGIEPFADGINYGPDTEKNYGIDGIYYLSSYLEYHYGFKKHKEVREVNLKTAKLQLSRIFGLGQASKIKPQVLLEYSKSIHSKIGMELEKSVRA